MRRPSAFIEVAFETARTFTDMLYTGTFARYPTSASSWRTAAGRSQPCRAACCCSATSGGYPNPQQVTPNEMRMHMRRLFLDTAATCPTTLSAALAMTTADKLVYGSDSGVPCTTDANIEALLAFRGLTPEQIQAVGRNALTLLPKAAARIAAG